MLFIGKLQKLLIQALMSKRLCTNLNELKLTAGRKWLIKQRILMHKTAVYTLVNGVITHQK